MNKTQKTDSIWDTGPKMPSLAQMATTRIKWRILACVPKPKRKTMAMQAALKVLVYTAETNEFLQRNDPKALEQALEALGIDNPYPKIAQIPDPLNYSVLRNYQTLSAKQLRNVHGACRF